MFLSIRAVPRASGFRTRRSETRILAECTFRTEYRGPENLGPENAFCAYRRRSGEQSVIKEGRHLGETTRRLRRQRKVASGRLAERATELTAFVVFRRASLSTSLTV